MKGEPEFEPAAAEQGKKNFFFIRCVRDGCNQILFGIGINFFAGTRSKTFCTKCESQMHILLWSISEEDPGTLAIRFECPKCLLQKEKLIPAVRRYCPKCKKNQLIYLIRLLDLAVPEPVPA